MNFHAQAIFIAVGMLLFVAPAQAFDSVWKDSVLYIRGGHDRNGNGKFDPDPGSNGYASGTTEIPDVRHESTANPQSNKIWYRGERGTTKSAASEVRHVTTDVVSAAWGTTLTNQPCLYFPAGNYETGKHYPQSFILWGNVDSTSSTYPITGDAYTVLARLKVDEFTDFSKTDNINAWLVGMQGANGEIRLGFRKYATKNANPYLNVALGNTTNPEAGNTNAAFTCGEWIEIAYVFNGKTVRVSCGRPGELRRWGNISVASSFSTRPTKPIFLGSVRNTSTYLTYNDDFRGSLHMFAMWNRALSDEEVMEAFGGPAGNLVRIGEESCSREMHVGSATTGDITLDQTVTDQRDWPTAFARGAKIIVPFVVDAYRAGLNQVLRLLPRAGSGAGWFEVNVDGNRVGSIAVRARAADGKADPSFMFIKGALLTAGEHRLVLTRKDLRTTAVDLDIIELGGSWRAGLKDGARLPNTGDGGSGGMQAFDGADIWYPASQNQADFVTYTAYKVDGNRHTKIQWCIPDGLAARACYRVKADRLWAGGSTMHVMALNGTELGQVDINAKAVQSYDLGQAKLVDGLNLIDCYYINSSGGPWVTYDDVSCEVSSCESDKVDFGLSILIR